MYVLYYEIGRFWVESESGQDNYLVDVLPGGGCDCDDYRIRVDGLEEKTTCKHWKAANEIWRKDFNPDEREQILKQQTR